MPTDTKPETLSLWGVRVPASDYCLIQTIAKALAMQSPVSFPLAKARRLAVREAMEAIGRTRRATGATPA